MKRNAPRSTKITSLSMRGCNDKCRWKWDQTRSLPVAFAGMGKQFWSIAYTAAARTVSRACRDVWAVDHVVTTTSKV